MFDWTADLTGTGDRSEYTVDSYQISICNQQRDTDIEALCACIRSSALLIADIGKYELLEFLSSWNSQNILLVFRQLTFDIRLFDIYVTSTSVSNNALQNFKALPRWKNFPPWQCTTRKCFHRVTYLNVSQQPYTCRHVTLFVNCEWILKIEFRKISELREWVL